MEDTKAAYEAVELVQGKHGVNSDTDPHLGPLDLPLVPVALIPTPFRLQKVQDT